ncbi:MAG: antibiotic ABC transporter [Pseudoalteromonas sp.]|uniref:peptidase domain-containing ABC transporter n=1 Tax=Pseudoalteromonas sp. TaxID=53249 RepID=UPI000C89AAFA|nr:peptidase domain-containing ABC transporter [Pseudoalteromonas sp.]MAD02401.1 antibiotic ABC transporter [Pseudoalteromonas sp.]|tara:strand:+ start:40604 stop:42718 length:2115 start_codon:yes stop_codon:yes gene_type:complete
MLLTDYIDFKSSKLPTFLQSEVAECGISCLAMIAYYHGYKVNMLAMRQRYPVGTQGITVKHILKIADDIGLSGRVLKLELGQLSKIKGPAILHWNFNHFVTLASVNRKGIVIHDPAKGKVKLDWKQVSESFTGIAIELTPSSTFTVADERVKMPLKTFIGDIDGLGSSLFKIFIIALILQCFLLISPYYIRIVIDHGIPQSDDGLLIWLLAAFLAITLLITFSNIIRSAAILYLDKNLGFQVKANIQRHLLHLPLSFFESRHVGDIKSRFEAFNEVQRMISRGFIAAIVEGLLGITTLVIMYTYSPTLALISLIFLSITLVIRLYLTKKENKHLEQALSKKAKENSHFLETIRAIMPIKCYVKESTRLSSWLNLFADTTNENIKREKISISAEISQELISKVEYLTVIFFGATLIINNAFTIGMFIAFLAYRQQFSSSTQTLVDHIFRFKLASTYLRRMSDIILQSQEQENNSLVIAKELTKGHIEVRDLHFRYSPSSPWLFRGINFEINAGESVAIIGRSGLGKSTLLKLMTGLIKAEQGDYLLDGHSINMLGMRNFRSMCATVMQNDQLLNGSLIENISFFEPKPDINQVIEAAKGAAIWQEIQAMPMGLHTQVGDLGSSLSGGQKQRLLLARALYSQPIVLFLDEATSHLDAATELQVNQHLKSKRITRISVAHRQETIKAADRVIDLEKLIKGQALSEVL